MSVYMNTPPAELKYVLRFQDNSECLTVVYMNDNHDIHIIQGSDRVLLSKTNDVEWLYAVLDDMRSLIREEKRLEELKTKEV